LIDDKNFTKTLTVLLSPVWDDMKFKQLNAWKRHLKVPIHALRFSTDKLSVGDAAAIAARRLR
jgi:hypothetical protein